MHRLLAAITDIPAQHALLITTEIGETAAELRSFCRRYEESVALALGWLPSFLWLKCGRLLGIFHIFDSADAIDEFLTSQPLQTMAATSSLDRSVFIQQFDVISFDQTEHSEVVAENLAMGCSIALEALSQPNHTIDESNIPTPITAT